MKSSILDLIKVRNPLIWVYSEEETYFIEDESSWILNSRVCNATYVYDVRGKISEVRDFRLQNNEDGKEYDSPVEAIIDFASLSSFDYQDLTIDNQSKWDPNTHGYPNGSVLFMLDVPFFMTDPGKTNHTNAILTRTLKVAAMQCVDQKKSIVIINHHKNIPIELENFVTFVHHPKAGKDDLRPLVELAQTFVSDPKIPPISLNNEEIEFVTAQLKGLTRWQAEHVLSLSNRQNAVEFLNHKTDKRQFKLEVIQQEKSRLISKSSTIEILHPERGLSGVGGMENFKKWVKDMELRFKPEAPEDGIDLPKGILVVGAGGTGKSHLAQCLAKEWNRTLLKLDISACMGSLLGQSEGNLIKALEDAEAQAPCVLFVDEFEKLFAGASGGNMDGGTFQRMYGTWLNWTQSRKEDVFVVATTNGVQNLPPPVLRKGRFDEIFFVDLPSTIERKEIFAIHLDKRGWNHEEFGIDIQSLADKTPNRTGSEIEHIVIQGIVNKVKRVGFGKNNPVETQDLLNAIGMVRTMFDLQPDESRNIRDWAKKHNVMFASLPESSGEPQQARLVSPPRGQNKRTIKVEEGEI
jgi:ATP-dependent 26S proteasome regulatory subunit